MCYAAPDASRLPIVQSCGCGCRDQSEATLERLKFGARQVASCIDTLSEGQVARLARMTRSLRASLAEVAPGLELRAVPAGATQLESTLQSGLAEVLWHAGRPLDRPVRHFMERRFDQNFGGVRVHTEGEAAAAARELGVAAFTLGRHVVFARGQFNPDHPAGRRLLAHELTHVLQQAAALKRQDVRLYFSQSHESQALLVARAVDARERTPAEVLRRTPLLAAPFAVQTLNPILARCGSICTFSFAPDGVLFDPRTGAPCGLVDCGFTSTPGPRAKSWCAYSCAGQRFGAFVINTVCGPVGPFFTDQFVN